MKKILSLAMVLTIAFLIGTGCQSGSTTNMTANNTNKVLPNSPAPKADDAPRITLADAKKDFDAGGAIFVDTRDEAAYKNGHVKGSINISINAVEAKYKELPRDKKIIAYCS